MPENIFLINNYIFLISAFRLCIFSSYQPFYGINFYVINRIWIIKLSSSLYWTYFALNVVHGVLLNWSHWRLTFVFFFIYLQFLPSPIHLILQLFTYNICNLSTFVRICGLWIIIVCSFSVFTVNVKWYLFFRVV